MTTQHSTPANGIQTDLYDDDVTPVDSVYPPSPLPNETLPSLNLIEPVDLTAAQKSCPDFKDIYAYLSSGIAPDEPRKAAKIVAEAEQYVLENDVLYHIYTPRTKKLAKSDRCIKQLALPTQYRSEALAAYHDSLLGGGHQGVDRTYLSLRQRFFWPRLYSATEEYVRSCDDCQKSKRFYHHHPAPLQPLPVADKFSRWHLDILGPLTKTPEGYQYIILAVDSFSCWCVAYPLKTQTATEIAKILCMSTFVLFMVCHDQF